MKRSKFSEAQIALVLKQAEDDTSVGEVCRKTGISEATFYAWRKKYAGSMTSGMRRLHQLGEGNAKLKRLVADLSLVLLRREDWDGNAKRIYRLYKEMGLRLRHKPPKRRVRAKLREDRCATSCSNGV